MANRTRKWYLMTIVLLGGLIGCAAPGPRSDSPPVASSSETDRSMSHTHGPEMPYPPERSPEVGDILHVPTGFYVTEEQMLRVATDSRVIYVGETHDNPASHRQELRVLAALADRYPGKVALGMEMFTPAQQPVLDRWVAGELEEKPFLKDLRWYETWRMDFDYYRELLLFARDCGIPVIGLNADKALVKAVRETPPSELPESAREKLPEVDPDDPYQRAMTEAVFSGHGHGDAGVEGFLRVQTLWDETMAENIAHYLRTDPDVHMLVVAGGNHVRHGFGIPRRVFRRLPVSYTLVGSKEIDIPEEKRDRLMDVETPSFPMPPYDFLAFTRYESLDKERVQMGVMLGESDEGVLIEGVMPGSLAEQAGVQKGDVLLRLDGQRVEDSFDVVYAVRQKKPGDAALLRLLRDGEEHEIRIVFDTPESNNPHQP